MSDTPANEPSGAYYAVAPSPWPAMCAAGALLLALGMVLYTNPGMLGEPLGMVLGALGPLLAVPGLAVVFCALYGWWLDVVREGTHEGRHSPPVQSALRRAMSLFIWADLMFFAAFFWAYFNASLYPSAAIGVDWPPTAVGEFNPFELPWLNTLILLTSGFSAGWARQDLKAGKLDHTALKLAIAIVLGASFVFILAFDFNRAAISLTDGIFATYLFVGVVLVGLHATVGVAFLTVSWMRLARGHFGPDNFFAFQAAIRFWRVVIWIWMLLFVSVIWWGSA